MSVWPPSKRRTVASRDHYRCHYCGVMVAIEDGTVDHVWPIHLGGGDANWNLVWSCEPCNHGQGHRTHKCGCPFCANAASQYVGLGRNQPLTHSLGDALRKAGLQ